MKNVVVGSSRREAVKASGAILVYSNDQGKAVYATVHPVSRETGSRRATIGPGRPVDRAALLESLTELARTSAPRACFLPESVLCVDSTALTWWCRPTMRRVFFDCPELGQVSAVVPHPGLVFRASCRGFQVFSVMCAERPGPDTLLHEPPYFNTWDGGRICIGSAQIPSTFDVASIDGWERGFFDSAFTHPNPGGKRINHPRGEFAFWKSMLDGQYGDQFPLEHLVPTTLTVAALIGG